MAEKEFNPNWRVHPVKSIVDFAVMCNISFMEMANALGLTNVGLAEFLARRIAINDEYATGLAKIFHNSKQFWLNLQKNFDMPITQTPGAYLTDLEGLTEGVDFKYIREVLTPDDRWIKAVRREWWDILPEDRKRLVAVPIEDANWEELYQIATYEGMGKKHRIAKLKSSFTIKRKQ